MKTLMTALLSVGVLMGAANAYADDDYHVNHQAHAGYQVAQVTTVAAAQKAYDDAPVRLQGTITRQVSYEHYELKDSTGSIIIDIDDDHGLATQLVGKTVTIMGELDKEYNHTKIDVKNLQIH